MTDKDMGGQFSSLGSAMTSLANAFRGYEISKLGVKITFETELDMSRQ